MLGARYERDEIHKLLKSVKVEDYFGELLKQDYLELIYGNDEVENLP